MTYPISKVAPYLFVILILGCTSKESKQDSGKVRVIFDTDANNELDDQHALAYLLFNGGSFELAGVTVNATRSGGDIESQYAEAVRVMKLCGYENRLPIYKGANSDFNSIQSKVDTFWFDGRDAVNFIIAEAKQLQDKKLVVIAVGKLTNIALALQKEPFIADRIRLVWLGSNYPEPGEYNLENDTASVNYVIKSGVEFDIVTVRYGKPSGSDAVKITKEEVNLNLRGRGPIIADSVTGRHGGTFNNFGDYSVSLFENIHFNGPTQSRALFDMVAVAIVKNPAWGKKTEVTSHLLIGNAWVEQPKSQRRIAVWENFDKEKILADFYKTMNEYHLVEIRE